MLSIQNGRCYSKTRLVQIDHHLSHHVSQHIHFRTQIKTILGTERETTVDVICHFSLIMSKIFGMNAVFDVISPYREFKNYCVNPPPPTTKILYFSSTRTFSAPKRLASL